MSALTIPGYELAAPTSRPGALHPARQTATGREVAIWVGSTGLDQRGRDRFQRDTRAAVRLSAHPDVVEVYDAGLLADTRPYLVVEPCPAGALADRGPRSPREVAELGQRIADVLVAAHDLGVPHGTITPAHLLVRRSGVVGLTGYGLATVTDVGDTAPRAEVATLVATLRALLTGDPADRSVPPGLAPELAAVLRRGLVADPARRYPDAATLRADLGQVVVARLASTPLAREPGRSPRDPADPADQAPVAAPASSAPGAGQPAPRGPGIAPSFLARVLLVVLLVVVLVGVGVFLLVR